MPAAIIEPILFWQVHQPLRPNSSARSRGGEAPGGDLELRDPDPAELEPRAGNSRPAAPAEPWRSQPFGRATPAGAPRRKATRYEKFTTRIVVVSSVLMLGVTAGLHILNYDLETKTSSTSGTHSGFYKADE